jgi:hypothetical protein
MVIIEKNKLVISLQDDDPIQLLKKIRDAISETTSVLVESDEFNYHADLPEAISTLIRLQKELFTENIT